MTDLERAQKIIEQYIHTLTWSPAATDDDITLVHGNVRGMASTIAAALAAVREEDARLCEEESQSVHLTDDRWDQGYKQACINNAAAIREKGKE